MPYLLCHIYLCGKKTGIKSNILLYLVKRRETDWRKRLSKTKNHLQFPVNVRLYCYLCPAAGPAALSHSNLSFSQAASQPCWAARAASFLPDMVDTSHQPDVGYGTCTSAWGKHFWLLLCWNSSVSLAVDTDLGSLWPPGCTRVLDPNSNLQNCSHWCWQTSV